jgi:HEAT repeat protein
MLLALDIASVVLALAGILTLLLLVGRRSVLKRQARNTAELEGRMRPVAIRMVEGEAEAPADLDHGAVRTLAAILARYARALRGESTERIAAFFERRGYVEEELQRLGSRRAWRRAGAAFALGDMGSSQAVPPLLKALGDRDRDVRAAAARSLGRLGAVEAVPSLVGTLAKTTVPRAVAGQALIAIGSPAAPALHALLHDEDARVRRAAAEVLGLVGDAADAAQVAGLLSDPAAEVRASAARALGNIGGLAESRALLVATQDRIPFVRTAVAHALGGIGDPQALPMLERQAATDEHDPAQAAAMAITRIDPEWAAGALRAPSVHMRQAASVARAMSS